MYIHTLNVNHNDADDERQDDNQAVDPKVLEIERMEQLRREMDEFGLQLQRRGEELEAIRQELNKRGYCASVCATA